ncbi:phage holin family protein [Enterococcus alishanensis]|uniref:Phage holin family protein n=1 Tax=Enterococcus alishanensis TaxID=1303817 RepID=A0ABS6TBH5_9ENTE|nr:phage holin family protein [Enterococcus alishanensis]MBV7390261.1 phage holin family protein [Enterococcus alishanensis]
MKELEILSLISIAMVLDLLTGIISARITKSISSKVGINGILRKIASLMLLLFLWPVAKIIPFHAGQALLYTFYLSFLWMEVVSILENYQKMGIQIDQFKKLLEQLKKK